MAKFGVWTPVSSGELPELFKPVLMTRIMFRGRETTMQKTVDAGIYLGDGKWRAAGPAGGTKFKNTVIGWMPYPKEMEDDE